MKRATLTATQAKQLADLVRTERMVLHLSMRQLASSADLPVSIISKIESGNTQIPQPKTLQALATALHRPVSDIYAVVGWLPADELPSFRPYMRSKYRNLNDNALADLERYIDELSRRIDNLGPIDHEDEDL